MPEVLRFYLAMQLAAAAALPFASRIFRALPDRGWGVAKVLGVFLLALADRWLAASGLLDAGPRARTALVLAALLAAAGAALAGRHGRRRLVALVGARRGLLLAIEGLFAVAFLAGALFRALEPGVEHTEQPMDFMLLANELDAPAWPPLDPWLAGTPVGYYTLGHAAAAALARLAGALPEVAYNLALAGWLALAAAALAGAGAALAGRAASAGARLAGAFAAPLVLVAANPTAIADGARRLVALGTGRAEPGEWWWWRASRLVFDESAPAGRGERISEFPQFAFAVGDLHAHLLALPLVVAAAALALALARGRRLDAAALAAAALLAALAAATNTWDLPLLLLLVAGGGAAGARGGAARARRAALAVGAALAGGALVALPHLVVAAQPIRGLAIHTGSWTSPGEFLALFGALLPGLALLLVGAVAARRGRAARRGIDLGGALLLAGVGVILVLAAEVVYLRDALEDRLNTLFKLHAAAWPLLALAAVAGGLAALRRGGGRALVGGAALATLAAGALYGAALTADRALARGPLTLDALAPLARRAPGELAAIRWVRDFVPRDALLLQAPGDSYRPEHCRIATATGRATLLGWRGHEVQWRGADYVRLAAGREAAAAEVYAGASAEAKAAALDRFGVGFVLIGPAERARYEIGAASQRALAQVAQRVFARDGVEIWRRTWP